MAGESPDKSKQRESSAEPTPGSGGPVPEARDPRLAVSRRTADTATRVLSVRDVPATAGGPEQEAEDSRLRAAVATWVRTGGSVGPDEEAQADSEPEDARNSEAKGGEAAAGSETEAGEAAHGSETEDEASADSDGEDDDQGATQSGSGANDEDESAADTEAKGEDGSAAAEAEDDEAVAQADSEGNGGAAFGSEADDEAHAESEPDGDRGTAQADTEPEDARSAAQANPEAKVSEAAHGSEAEDEASADSDGEDDGQGATQSGSGANDEDESAADTEAKGEDESATADSEPEGDRGTAQADTEPEDARSAAQANPEAKDGDAAPASETGNEARAESEPEDGEAPEAGGGVEGEDERPGADDAAVEAADAESASAPKADADAKGSAPKSTPDPRTPRDPRPADGEDAPQGPPAPKDESRTGGAGGNRKAEGGAEADAKPTDAPKSTKAPKPPVDHPTAVFKAPRPKPQVDQPTTMLKLGGTPKPKPTEPADAERTSKFVALKPLDDPATRKPKPPAQAPADVTTAVPQVGPERTTQQPLPPKPPLDLLAELTNTPPPPETPVRTIVRRVKIWTPLVILLVIIFAVVQALRPLPAPALALTAEESYQFDGGKVTLPWPSEGQGWMDVDGIGTMDSFGKQTPVAIGSVAKTMTAYIVLKDHPLKAGEEGPTITVDATAEKEGGYDKTGESTLNSIKAGDKLTLRQALSAVMIPSANNIARLLARWDAGGSEAAFVKKMNATAKELGMTATTYTDPSGLKESTVSTAGDQVKLGNAVVKIPALVAITSAASWKDPSGHNWPNYNQLPYLVGAIGIKTGSTTAAGGNLLFAARKKVGGETVTVVGAILGQHKPSILDTVNAVSKTALLAAEDALTSAKTVKKGDVVGYVDDGLDGHTPVVVTEDVTAVGWAGLKVKLSFASDTVPHTAKAGTKVGTLTVGDGKTGAVQVPVALKEDLTEPGFGSKLTRLG